MNSLPGELLHNVLHVIVEDSRHDKNAVLRLRYVCKAFNEYLRPQVLKALQLDVSRILQPCHEQERLALQRAGTVCEALFCDVSLARDESRSCPSVTIV